MKKCAFLLAFVLSVSLTACDRAPGNTPDDTTATVTTTATATTTAPLVGENDGVTYKNTHFGIAFTPADGWDLFDNDEIADRNLPILSMADGETYADAVNRAQEFYDMYAVQESTGNSIAVRVENMATMYDFLPTAEEYRTMQTSMLEGVPDLSFESVDVTLDGTEIPALKVLWGGGENVQTDLFVYVIKDSYMLSLELSSTDGDHAAEWLSWFDRL